MSNAESNKATYAWRSLSGVDKRGVYYRAYAVVYYCFARDVLLRLAASKTKKVRAQRRARPFQNGDSHLVLIDFHAQNLPQTQQH